LTFSNVSVGVTNPDQLGKIKEFYARYPETKNALERFYKILKVTNFDSFNELKKSFPSVDIVGKFTVFNVSGNKVRIIAATHYNTHKIYLRWVLTHEEYDKDKWKSDGTASN